MYTLKGELKVIGDVQQISDSFKKRDFVVVDASGQYAQTISFQAVQDRTELLEGKNVGDIVEVTFFLRGREWVNPKDGEVRYFNTLDAWKIDVQGKSGQGSAVKPNEDFAAEGDDDLPF